MINKKLSQQVLYQRALDKVPRLRGLVEVVKNAEGKITYKSSFDGKEFNDIPSAVGHIEATGINTYRVFGPNQMGKTKGLDQIAAEATELSNRLRNVTGIQREALQKLGLGFVLNQDANITYSKFKYEGKAQKLADIVRTKFVKDAGIVNITDDGVTVLNYSVGKKVLTAQQAKEMKYVLGLGTLTDNFVDKVLGSAGTDSFKSFGKLPKRIQGMLAERDVSLASGKVEEILTKKAYKFDDVPAFFNAMFGAKTTQSERFLLAHGLGLTEEEARMASLTKGGTDIFRNAIAKKFGEISGITDNAEMLRIFDFWLDAKNQYGQLSKAQQKKKSIFNIFEENIKNPSNMTSDSDRALMSKIEASMAGVERMRDGEFIGNPNLVNSFIKELQAKRSAITAGTGQISAEQLQEIKDIDNVLDSLRHAKEMGQEGLESVIARLQFPGMQGKGEMYLRKFDWLPKGLRDKLLIMPKSALKNEVQGIPSILLNIAKSHEENVYSDPLMLLYHQDYFGSEEFTKGAVNNVNKQMKAIEDFMKTGAMPDEVKKEILGSIKSELEPPVPIARMDALSKANYLRNRAEAKTIQEMLQSGVDPREIPALVRRITDYYSTNAFRLKGERVDLVMPDVTRLALRTYESSGESGLGSKLYQQAQINLRSLGIDEADQLADLIGEQGNLNFVQFRVKGNRMMFQGSAAHLYHHALGTFDLDDKGLPLMTTFKDADGSDRLAFMVMRQPTGFQEKIFMQADLRDLDTLKAVLKNKKRSGDFQALLNDPDVYSSLNAREQRILGLLKQISNDKDVDLSNESGEDIEKLLAKLRQNHGQKHGFADLIKMTAEEQIEMSLSQSASPLGMDKIIKAGIHSSADDVEFRSFLAQHGIKPDAMPEYTTGNFINVLIDETANLNEKDFVNIFNKSNKSTFKSHKEIKDYIDSLQKGSSDSLAVQSRYRQALQTFSEKTSLSSVREVEDTLGLYINRQSFAVSMHQQVADVLSSMGISGVEDVKFGKVSLNDFYKLNFSAAFIDPSAAVDLSKALVSMAVEDPKMLALAAAMDQLRGQGMNISEEAVSRAMKRLNIKNVRLGQMGEEIITQTGRGFGFLRAMQIAQGKPVEELIGFDEALFGEGAYARIRKQDTQKLVEKIREGAVLARKQTTDQNELDRINSFISSMDRLDAQSAIKELSLKAGSKYNVVGKFAEQATLAREAIEGQIAYSRRLSRTARDPYEAVLNAKYMSQVEAMVEAQQDNLTRTMELARGTFDSFEEQAMATVESNLRSSRAATEFMQGISAIKQIDQSADILDVVDTLEATIRTQFGGRTAETVLRQNLELSGQENLLVELFDKAKTRRINRATIRSVNQDAFERLENIFSRSYLSQNLGYRMSDITEDLSRQLIGLNNITQAYTGTPLFDTELEDFLIARAGYLDQAKEAGRQVSEDAVNVSRRVAAEQSLQSIDQYVNDVGASYNLLRPYEVPDEVKALVRNVDEADDVSSFVKGSYVRFKDAIKNGTMRELFDDKLIRNSAYAAIGLAAFGFIYSARKERTQEEIAGPPLLPGGSAYETDFPRNLPSISDLKYLNPTAAGMQYKINVIGSEQDIQKMQYLAGGVVDGPVDSTIYDSLPRLGRDPYSNIASRY